MGFKGFDAYTKVRDDMKVQTVSGAAVSLVTILFVIILFFTEISRYLTGESVYGARVDTLRAEEMLPIYFDVSFPHIPCAVLSLDAMDVGGTRQLDVMNHNVNKQDIDQKGLPVGQADKHHMIVVNEKPPEGLTAEQLRDVEKTKQPGYCGSCYGAEIDQGQCCNTCDDVKKAYRAKGWALPADSSVMEQCLAAPKSKVSIPLPTYTCS